MKPSADHYAAGAGFSSDVLRSGAITVVAQISTFTIQFGSALVLARLLLPSDFGMVAMAATFLGFVRVFEDLGLTAATVQAKQLGPDQLSSLFWINLAFGFFLWLFCMACSPVLAWFFKSPEVMPIAMVSSCSILITAAAAQHRAVLTRNMRFGWLATAEIASISCGLLVAIPFALWGFKYGTLVAMNLTTSLAQASCLIVASGWRPMWPKSLVEVRPLLVFGRNYSLVHLINYFARDFDKVLVGKFSGADALGIYGRAYSLFVLPLSQLVWPVGRVALSTLSKLQGNPARYANYYLSALYLIVFILTPCSVLLATMPSEIIFVLYGEKWVAAAPILTCLALSMPIQPVFSCVNWLYITTNRTGALLKYHSMGAVIICVSMIVAASHGPKAVALAYSVAVLFWTVPGYFATCGSPVAFSQLYKAIYTSLLSGALAAMISIILKNYVDSNRFRIWTVIFHGGVIGVVYLGFALLIFRQGPKLRLMLRMAKSLFSK